MKDRLAPLDGLRGLAIVLVGWYHLWQITWLDPLVTIGGRTFGFDWLPISGFLGVELFFFISAFCLTYPYARARFGERTMPTVQHFAWRRFIKIVPSYVLSIAAMIALGTVHYSDVAHALFDIGAHLGFVHTFFGDSFASINGVLWSLAIEVQFYVAFPLLVAAMLARPLLTTGAMVAIASAYRVRTMYFSGATGPLIDHNMNQFLGMLDIFALGMFCAFSYEWILHRRSRWAGASIVWTCVAGVALVALGLLFADLVGHRRETDYENWWKMLHLTLFAAAVFALTLGSLYGVGWWKRTLANPVLVFLSVISYNLYLWHQVLMRMVGDRVPHASADPHGDLRWRVSSFVLGIVVPVLVATLVTYVFEKPLLKWDGSRPARFPRLLPRPRVRVE